MIQSLKLLFILIPLHTKPLHVRTNAFLAKMINVEVWDKLNRLYHPMCGKEQSPKA